MGMNVGGGSNLKSEIKQSRPFGSLEEPVNPLLYVLASARLGQWMIPAFHANVDRGIAKAHDDPQHFDLAAFDDEVGRWLRGLGTPPSR